MVIFNNTIYGKYSKFPLAIFFTYSNVNFHVTLSIHLTLSSICCMAQETQTEALYQSRGLRWGERWEGGSKGRGYMCIYGWFILKVWQKTTICKAIILQLKINKLILKRQLKIMQYMGNRIKDCLMQNWNSLIFFSLFLCKRKTSLSVMLHNRT